MRVIAGECKGRPLKAVPGKTTRPTTDKVKESIFNMIGPFFDGGIGLDLYSGSGGLSIEALSRGLEKMIMVDSNPKAIETIKANLLQCGYENRTEVYRNDAERALKAIVKRGLQLKVIFLDPPYQRQKIAMMLAVICDHNLLNSDGVVVVEHAIEVELPDLVSDLSREKYEEYGATAVSIYSKISGQGGE